MVLGLTVRVGVFLLGLDLDLDLRDEGEVRGVLLGRVAFGGGALKRLRRVWSMGFLFLFFDGA